jgi:hypothetical protein
MDPKDLDEAVFFDPQGLMRDMGARTTLPQQQPRRPKTRREVEKIWKGIESDVPPKTEVELPQPPTVVLDDPSETTEEVSAPPPRPGLSPRQKRRLRRWRRTRASQAWVEENCRFAERSEQP